MKAKTEILWATDEKGAHRIAGMRRSSVSWKIRFQKQQNIKTLKKKKTRLFFVWKKYHREMIWFLNGSVLPFFWLCQVSTSRYSSWISLLPRKLLPCVPLHQRQV
jgi:hypothetical protein